MAATSVAGAALAVGLSLSAPADADVVAEQLDPAHTGVSAASVGPPLRERWRRVFDPNVPISHEVRWPLVAGGRVFITYQDRDGGPGQLLCAGSGERRDVVVARCRRPAGGRGLRRREGLRRHPGRRSRVRRGVGGAGVVAQPVAGPHRNRIDGPPVAADGVVYVGVPRRAVRGEHGRRRGAVAARRSPRAAGSRRGRPRLRERRRRRARPAALRRRPGLARAGARRERDVPRGQSDDRRRSRLCPVALRRRGL